MKVQDFQKLYPTREEKEKALAAMSNEEINELIQDANNIQAKIFYSKFRKREQEK